MKNTYLLFAFLLLFITTQSQVTITQADLEAELTIGNTVTTFVDTLTSSVDVGTAGQGSWDFSGLQSQFQLDATSIDPSTSPAAGTFSGATHATYSNPTFAGVTLETWVHLSVGGGTYGNMGAYTTASTSGFTTTTTIVIDPPESIYQLPLNYNDSWTESGTRSFSVEVAGFPQNHDVDYTSTNTVDAYGALTMPDGTIENVIRIKTETELTSNAGGVPTTSNYVDFVFLAPSGSFLAVNTEGTGAASGGTVNAVEVSWNYGDASTDVEQIEELATDFYLAQNYPNPFNPTTNIQYSIPKTSDISLKVYDILGNEVATLVDRKQSAGVYNAKFDGSNLASGIYFYTLRAGSFSSTKKLMLVR